MKNKTRVRGVACNTTKTHFKDFRGIDIFLSCVPVREDGLRAVRYEGGVLDYIKPHQFTEIGKMLLHTGVFMETSDDEKKVNKLEFIFRNDVNIRDPSGVNDLRRHRSRYAQTTETTSRLR